MTVLCIVRAERSRPRPRSPRCEIWWGRATWRVLFWLQSRLASWMVWMFSRVPTGSKLRDGGGSGLGWCREVTTSRFASVPGFPAEVIFQVCLIYSSIPMHQVSPSARRPFLSWRLRYEAFPLPEVTTRARAWPPWPWLSVGHPFVDRFFPDFLKRAQPGKLGHWTPALDRD